jgi:hypothetical protein
MFCEGYPVENARIDFADFHVVNVLTSAKAAYDNTPSRPDARATSTAPVSRTETDPMTISIALLETDPSGASGTTGTGTKPGA